MSAKFITIVTVSIFGSVFFGIFLSTLIFSPDDATEGIIESGLSKTIPEGESTVIKPHSSTSTRTTADIIPSSSTKVE